MPDETLKWIPLVNSFGLLVGYIYAMMIIKISMDQIKEKLDRIASKVDDHEHRITLMEGANSAHRDRDPDSKGGR